MSGDSELLTPAPQTPPPAQDAAPPVTPPVEDREPEVLEIPTGEKLVPLSALEAAREKAKGYRSELETVRAEAGKSAEKDARIAELQQQLQQIAPLAQAYQAAVEAQQRQPQKLAEPSPEETAELKEIAQELDFYKTDGSLDLDRAQKHQNRIRREAEKIAQQQVQPYEQQTTADKSSFNLQRALITKTPTGAQPDPDVLREVWARLDPRLTATPQGAAQAFSVALGHSVLLGKTSAKAPEPIPEPLHTEKAGGRDVVPVTLTDSDKRMARDLGLTDKQYAEQLAEMPAGWGKGA